MMLAVMDHPDLARRDLSSWQSTASGGSQVHESLVRRIEETLGIDFTIIYGQTECTAALTSTLPSDSAEDKGSHCRSTVAAHRDTNRGPCVTEDRTLRHLRGTVGPGVLHDGRLLRQTRGVAPDAARRRMAAYR